MAVNEPKDQGQTQSPLVEISNIEKILWASIHLKGLLDKDVQDLYRKARSSYENIILNSYDLVDLQDVEYSLWKLHYKHIDEFRKKIREASNRTDSTRSAIPQGNATVEISFNAHVEGFKSFLLEATAFYQNLIKTIRRSVGLQEELFLTKEECFASVENKKLCKCKYTCHRFLICLGDLSRYTELCKKPDIRNHDWSTTAKYYIEASRIWPLSGNSHNQLALLATYVGDDFLALYHCFRSLAVEEPFPDAWNNLMLLFEKNRSSHLHLISGDAYFDFLKPSERIVLHSNSLPSGSSPNKTMVEAAQPVSSWQMNFGPLFVRMISFFLISSSLEEFPCTFTSTLRDLEALMELDNDELRASKELYQRDDSVGLRPSPILQLVSILIFVIHWLIKGSKMNLKRDNDKEQFALMQLALSAVFVCMGRLSERSGKGGCQDACPLLPAVMVFVEWLIFMIDEIGLYGSDDKVASTMSYFIGSFVDLLNQLDTSDIEGSSPDHIALWEDFELRGFDPLSSAHASLNFASNIECMENFANGNQIRISRIFNAVLLIVDRFADFPKLMVRDKLEKKFYQIDGMNFREKRKPVVKDPCSDLKENVPSKSMSETMKSDEKNEPGENQNNISLKGKSVAMDEEEVILFKPITRYNSAPIYADINTGEQVLKDGVDDQAEPADEFLRRATSLISPQSGAQNDFNLYPDITNFGQSQPAKQQDSFSKDIQTYAAGPPSLSAWVPNRDGSKIGKEKGTRDFFKHGLDPIDELAFPSLSGLSISRSTDISACSEQLCPPIYNSPSPYAVPVPSAPLLPEDAAWFRGNPSSFLEPKTIGGNKEADGILGASPVSRYSNGPVGHVSFETPAPYVPGLFNLSPPLLGLSSSEWLHQYRTSQNDSSNKYASSIHMNTPVNYGNLNVQNPHGFDMSGLIGRPLIFERAAYMENPQLFQGESHVYGSDGQRREGLFLGYQRPSPYPYGCGAGNDLRTEQPPLLQYLKDREWQLRLESQIRGPTYTGS